MTDLPTLRWGIVATGMISSWFVQDLTLHRRDAKANHIIQAVAASTRAKAEAFVETHLRPAGWSSPAVYGSYAEVHADPAVDIVYIGTPHAFHKRNCLDAIRAGKHVLCEKPLSLNAAEAREVFAAAKSRGGIFVMEGLWTRFFPLTATLRQLIHAEKVIGDIHRVFCDFGLKQDIASLGLDSRLRDPALGAGSLLDIGIYSLTWGLMALDAKMGMEAEKPVVVAAQSLAHEVVDVASSIVLRYPDGRQGILTSTSLTKTPPAFCRIEGSEGFIVVDGPAASVPASFTVHSSREQSGGSTTVGDSGLYVKKYEFERPGKGFYWEADAVALEINAGKMESAVMPWAETVRVLEMLDEVRRQGGAKFPQDQDAQ